MRRASVFIAGIISVMICSCGTNEQSQSKDSIAVKLPVAKPWYPASRHQADSSGQCNWIDANRQRQGFWKMTGAMMMDHTYDPSSIVEEGFYLDSQKKGWWKTYSPNGALKDSTYWYWGQDSLNFVDAKRLYQGHWRITGAMERDEKYSADAVVREGVFVNGKRVGVWTFYTPTGKVDHYVTFTSDSLTNEQ